MDPLNPYAPPAANLDPVVPDIEPEATPLDRSHRAARGGVLVLAAIDTAFGAVGILACQAAVVIAAAERTPIGQHFLGHRRVLRLEGLYHTIPTLLIGVGLTLLGSGLRRLRKWARWVTIVLWLLPAALTLLEFVITGHPVNPLWGIWLALAVLIMLLLISKPVNTLISAESRRSLARTTSDARRGRTTSILLTIAAATLLIIAVLDTMTLFLPRAR